MSDFPVLIMKTKDGSFYPISVLPNVDMKKQAKDHGEINDHLASVEDIDGNTLWERTYQ